MSLITMLEPADWLPSLR